ncbi:MAG: hypothetical protein ACAI38_07350 [Myxococcota bacterium]
MEIKGIGVAAVPAAPNSVGQINFKLTGHASRLVSAYLEGKVGDVTEVRDPKVLKALEGVPVIGNTSAGAVHLGSNTTEVKLGVVKILDGRLYYQGPTQGRTPNPKTRTFDCGFLPAFALAAG